MRLAFYIYVAKRSRYFMHFNKIYKSACGRQLDKKALSLSNYFFKDYEKNSFFKKFLKFLKLSFCFLLFFYLFRFFSRDFLDSFMTESVSYRNQSISLLCKPTDLFLDDTDLRHERVNVLGTC